jgi:hypothetical protein
MLDVRTVQTIHFVYRGLYGPEVDGTFATMGEAITHAAKLKAQQPDQTIYIETREYTAVLEA